MSDYTQAELARLRKKKRVSQEGDYGRRGMKGRKADTTEEEDYEDWIEGQYHSNPQYVSTVPFVPPVVVPVNQPLNVAVPIAIQEQADIDVPGGMDPYVPQQQHVDLLANLHAGYGIHENKYLDTAVASYVSDTTGSVTLLNGVATGATNITRNGNQVNFRSIYFKGYWRTNDNTTSPGRHDCFILLDKQPAAAVPAITDFLVTSNSLSHQVVSSMTRFIVIAHRYFVCGKISDTATQSFACAPLSSDCTFYKKLNFVTTYKTANAGIADISTGALYLLTIASAAAASGCDLQASVRLVFTE